MKTRGVVLGAVVVLAALVGPGRADDERLVSIELKTGEKVSGRLVGFAERRYRVKIGDSTVAIREEDVKRLEFGDAAPATPPPAAVTSTATVRVLAALGDVKGLTRTGARYVPETKVRSERLFKADDFAMQPVDDELDDLATATYALGTRPRAVVHVLRYPDATRTEIAAGLLVKRATELADYATATVTVLRAGLVVATIRDEGLPAASARQLGDAARAALATGTGAPVDAPVTIARKFASSALSVPKERLPDGLDSIEIETPEAFEPSSRLYVMGNAARVPHRYRYGGPGGARVEIDVFRDSLEAPTLAQTKPYDFVWHARKVIVAMKTAKVSAETASYFTTLVAAELEYASDTRGATLVKAVGPEASAPKVGRPLLDATRVSLADFVPAPEELPPGFRLERKYFFGPGQSGDVAHTGMVSLQFVERASLTVGIYKAKDDTHESLRVSLIAGSGLVDLLDAGSVVIAITEQGSVTLAGREAIIALYAAKLEKLAPGGVRRTTLPTQRARFTSTELELPAPSLPAGVSPGPSVPWELRSGFIDANVERAGYAYVTTGSATVTLYHHKKAKWVGLKRVIDSDEEFPLGGLPTKEELRPFHAVWHSEKKAVAMQVKGTVAPEVIAWFEKTIEAALRKCADTREAKRLEIPARRLLAAADVVPRVDELPPCVTVESESNESEYDLRTATYDLQATSPSRGPLLAAMNAKATGASRVSYFERGRIRLAARGYGSLEDAAAGFEATRRAIPHFFSKVREMFLIENVVAVLEDQDSTARGFEAYRAAFVARARSLGEVRSETNPLEVRAELRLIAIPPAWLPAGYSQVENRNSRWVGSSIWGDRCDTLRAEYTDRKGMVTLVAYSVDSTPKEPTSAQLRDVQYAWSLEEGRKAFALRVTGVVQEEALQTFVKHVETELARCVGGRSVKRHDVSRARLEKLSVGEVYVFNSYEKDASGKEQRATVWFEVLELFPNRVRIRRIAHGESTIEELTIVAPEPIQEHEAPVTLELSGVLVDCAASKTRALRPLKVWLPGPVKSVGADGRVLGELAEIQPSRQALSPEDLPVDGFTLTTDGRALVVSVVTGGSRAQRLGFQPGDRVVLMSKAAHARAVAIERGKEVVVIPLDD